MIRRFDGSNWVDLQYIRKYNGTNWVDLQYLRKEERTNWIDILDSDLVLYDYGDEKTNTTGGWNSFWFDLSYTSGDVTKNADNLQMYELSSGYGNRGFQSAYSINTSAYSIINFSIEVLTNYTSSSYVNRFFVSMSPNYETYLLNNANMTFLDNWDLGINDAKYSIQTKSFKFSGQGLRYIQFVPFSGSYGQDRIDIKVYKIWLSR